ncbi:hypothetical protein BDW22DRAFT_1140568 [Trametopsis cervina]|nr:hypothetical protein BDW22DRAFT_1140568 [Trametopsis cervina]
MSDACKIRIAVALSALKRKHCKQSFEAFVLDLRVQFPLRPLPDAAGSKLELSELEPWKNKVSSLEKEMNDLREKYQHEHSELVVLRAASAKSSTGASTCSTGTPTAEQSKTKKRSAGQRRSEPHISGQGNNGTVLKCHSIDYNIQPGLEAQRDVFCAAERTLQALASCLSLILAPNPRVSLDPGTLSDLAVLLDRLLTTVFRFLYAHTINANRRKKRKSLQAPSSPHEAMLDTLLGILTTSILAPLVSSFYVLSSKHLSAILGTSKYPLCDVRPHALRFLQSAVESLRGVVDLEDRYPSYQRKIASYIQDVYGILLLSAARQLENLYVPCDVARQTTGFISHCSTEEPRAATSKPCRFKGHIERLARKDSMWYLSSIIQSTTVALAEISEPTSTVGLYSSSPGSLSTATLPSTAPSSSSTCTSQVPSSPDQLDGPVHTQAQEPDAPLKTAAASHTLIMEGVCTALSGLLRPMQYSDPRTTIDRTTHHCWSSPGETEKSMVLAVAEKVWLSLG